MGEDLRSGAVVDWRAPCPDVAAPNCAVLFEELEDCVSCETRGRLRRSFVCGGEVLREGPERV